MNAMLIAAIILFLLNLNCFLMMGADKRRARRDRWRIPERRLFLAAACFGALGGVLGMQFFRHKTRHLHFRLGFPLLLAAQIALLVWGYGLL